MPYMISPIFSLSTKVTDAYYEYMLKRLRPFPSRKQSPLRIRLWIAAAKEHTAYIHT